MEKESFAYFEGDSFVPDVDSDESKRKRRKKRSYRDDWEGDFRKKAARERKRRKERQKVLREKDRMKWDDEG